MSVVGVKQQLHCWLNLLQEIEKPQEVKLGAGAEGSVLRQLEGRNFLGLQATAFLSVGSWTIFLVIEAPSQGEAQDDVLKWHPERKGGAFVCVCECVVVPGRVLICWAERWGTPVCVDRSIPRALLRAEHGRVWLEMWRRADDEGLCIVLLRNFILHPRIFHLFLDGLPRAWPIGLERGWAPSCSMRASLPVCSLCFCAEFAWLFELSFSPTLLPPLSGWRILGVFGKFQAEECRCDDHIHKKRMWERQGEVRRK